MPENDGFDEVELTYQQAEESYTSLKDLSNFRFGGDAPGQTKYRLCPKIIRQLRPYAEEFSIVKDDLRIRYGEDDFERDKKGDYKLDPETNKKINIGKSVRADSKLRKEFLDGVNKFGGGLIPGKIKIPKNGIILTTIGDPGDMLEPLCWVLRDVIFEEEKEPSIDTKKTLEEIKKSMTRIEEKLKKNQ